MEAKPKRQRVKPGDVLRVDLGDGGHAYALASTSPLVVFFDHRATSDFPADGVLKLSVAFKVWVSKPVLSSGRWPRVGHVDPPPELLEAPLVFRQDALSGRLSV